MYEYPHNWIYSLWIEVFAVVYFVSRYFWKEMGFFFNLNSVFWEITISFNWVWGDAWHPWTLETQRAGRLYFTLLIGIMMTAAQEEILVEHEIWPHYTSPPLLLSQSFTFLISLAPSHFLNSRKNLFHKVLHNVTLWLNTDVAFPQVKLLNHFLINF